MTIVRFPWDKFPAVWIHAKESDVKRHLAYRAAKSGDPKAAHRLVNDMLLTENTVYKLRSKHGCELEKWWQRRFGFCFDCLTESEARYLLNTPTAERVRDKITEAEQG